MDKTFAFESTASVGDLALTFREVVQKTKAPGRGFMANRMAGSVRFYTPNSSDDPFAQMGPQPDFEVVAEVPLTGGFSVDVVTIMLCVYDLQTTRRAVVVLDGPSVRRAGSRYADALRDGFCKLDPGLEMLQV